MDIQVIKLMEHFKMVISLKFMLIKEDLVLYHKNKIILFNKNLINYNNIKDNRINKAH
jgi:hypothetical protein